MCAGPHTRDICSGGGPQGTVVSSAAAQMVLDDTPFFSSGIHTCMCRPEHLLAPGAGLGQAQVLGPMDGASAWLAAGVGSNPRPAPSARSCGVAMVMWAMCVDSREMPKAREPST